MKLAIPVIALALAAATTVAATQKAPKAGAPPLKPFSVVEATIPEMRLALEQKRTTSREAGPSPPTGTASGLARSSRLTAWKKEKRCASFSRSAIKGCSSGRAAVTTCRFPRSARP